MGFETNSHRVTLVGYTEEVDLATVLSKIGAAAGNVVTSLDLVADTGNPKFMISIAVEQV